MGHAKNKQTEKARASCVNLCESVWICERAHAHESASEFVCASKGNRKSEHCRKWCWNPQRRDKEPHFCIIPLTKRTREQEWRWRIWQWWREEEAKWRGGARVELWEKYFSLSKCRENDAGVDREWSKTNWRVLGIFSKLLYKVIQLHASLGIRYKMQKMWILKKSAAWY